MSDNVEKLREIAKEIELSLYDFAHGLDKLHSVNNKDTDQAFVRKKSEVERYLSNAYRDITHKSHELAGMCDCFEGPEKES